MPEDDLLRAFDLNQREWRHVLEQNQHHTSSLELRLLDCNYRLRISSHMRSFPPHALDCYARLRLRLRFHPNEDDNVRCKINARGYRAAEG